MALIFVTVVGSMLIPSQLTITYPIYASESSPYGSGYDHGCDDAGLSESDKYINQPEKGPSFHTGEFMVGYYTGLNACGSGSRDAEPPQSFQPSQSSRGGIYWWGICTNPIVDALITEPCDTLVTSSGYELTAEGQRVLFCVVGGGALYLVDPAAGEMARQMGPSVGCG